MAAHGGGYQSLLECRRPPQNRSTRPIGACNEDDEKQNFVGNSAANGVRRGSGYR